MIVHNANASFRTLAQISDILAGKNDELMDQPPHSADLTPFFLLPHIKEILRGRFSSNTIIC